MNNIISLSNYKHRKQLKSQPQAQDDNELAARIERIKGSIKRINELMAELRQIKKPD